MFLFLQVSACITLEICHHFVTILLVTQMMEEVGFA